VIARSEPSVSGRSAEQPLAHALAQAVQRRRAHAVGGVSGLTAVQRNGKGIVIGQKKKKLPPAGWAAAAPAGAGGGLGLGVHKLPPLPMQPLPWAGAATPAGPAAGGGLGVHKLPPLPMQPLPWAGAATPAGPAAGGGLGAHKLPPVPVKPLPWAGAATPAGAAAGGGLGAHKVAPAKPAAPVPKWGVAPTAGAAAGAPILGGAKAQAQAQAQAAQAQAQARALVVTTLTALGLSPGLFESLDDAAMQTVVEGYNLFEETKALQAPADRPALKAKGEQAIAKLFSCPDPLVKNMIMQQMVYVYMDFARPGYGKVLRDDYNVAPGTPGAASKSASLQKAWARALGDTNLKLLPSDTTHDFAALAAAYGIEENEARAIHLYTSDYYKHLNPTTRMQTGDFITAAKKGPDSASHQNVSVVKLAVSGMNKMPKIAGPHFRYAREYPGWAQAWRKGATIREAALKSTAKDFKAAWGNKFFAGGVRPGKVLEVAYGRRGVNVESISPVSEGEVLYPPGSPWKVVDVLKTDPTVPLASAPPGVDPRLAQAVEDAKKVSPDRQPETIVLTQEG
jgi:hypothetical protein